MSLDCQTWTKIGVARSDPLRREEWSRSSKVCSGIVLWLSSRSVCVWSLFSCVWCVCVGMDPGLTCWLMASVCMCEKAPGPVSMLMSSGRWERGGWTNNEQTHQQPYNLKRPNRGSCMVCFLTDKYSYIMSFLLVCWSMLPLNTLNSIKNMMMRCWDMLTPSRTP